MILDTRALDIVNTWIATRDELLQRNLCPQVSFVNRSAASMVYMLRNLTSYDAYEKVAKYLCQEGLERLGFKNDYITSPWQKEFFDLLKDGSIQEALMQLMHVTYEQQITGHAKDVAKQNRQAKEIKELKQAKAKMAEGEVTHA